MKAALGRRFPFLRRVVRPGGDGGFTLVEMVVVILILGIVFAITSSLLISFNQQTTNIRYSLAGVTQANLAGQTFVQYLRGATEVLPAYNSVGAQVAPSATEFDAIVSEGFDATTSTSNCTNLDALWFLPPGARADAQFDVTFDVPAAGPANGKPTPPLPWSSISPGAAVPTAYTPASSCTPASSTSRTVATYYAYAAQSMATNPVFTYYAYDSTSKLYALPIEDPVPACAISEIVAVGVHVTFLAGPQLPTQGFAADQPTTLDTIVYLRGSSTTPAVATTTTSTTSACAE